MAGLGEEPFAGKPGEPVSAGRTANHMRLQAAMVAGLVGKPKVGLVTSYDGDVGAYLVKVTIQPEGYETGWLPIEALQGGNGWGIYAAPHIGDQAVIHFLEGDREVGWCSGFLPSDVDAPPAVPEGEIHLIHKDGAYLKFLTGGEVLLNAPEGVRVTAEVHVTGSLSTTGNLMAGTGASGTFTTADGLTVTVQDGVVTNIY